VPVNIGKNSVGWIESEIDDFLRRCIAERDHPTPEVKAVRASYSERGRRGAAARTANLMRRKQANKQKGKKAAQPVTAA
jgi:hypothetical protein